MWKEECERTHLVQFYALCINAISDEFQIQPAVFKLFTLSGIPDT